MHRLVIVMLAASLVGCGRSSSPESSRSLSADDRVRTLADDYVNGYFDRFPEQVTYYGVAGRAHDRWTDNSLSALAAWEAREDAWLKEVEAINPAMIESGSLRAAYAILREALESAAAIRVCRNELWSVNQMVGWHVVAGYLATIQPIGSEQARKEALARWSTLPDYLDREIANLREGVKRGYTAPRHIVRTVADEVRALAVSHPDAPLLAPVRADKTPEFATTFTALVNDEILPAMRRYVEFLDGEYLSAARDAVSVASHPDGAACYEASIRAFSTLPKSAREVHDVGLREVARIDAQMKAIAEQSFGTSDVPGLMERLRTDRAFLFRDREELISYSQAALARAQAVAPKWFGLLPRSGVRIEPFPAYREVNAPGEYNPPSEDGSRPGLFYISAYQAEKKSRAGNESTAFHETIPGHHLQTAIALEAEGIHPIGRYVYSSGFVEGWALYAEQLADEMRLFSSQLDRLGMLAMQNFRAVRLVVDTGLHAFGWTRQQAIDYMLAHTTSNAHEAAAEIDRYIIWPGQATSYMLGHLEILAAREEARRASGSAFDIRTFHDRVLEDGSVPLSFMREKVRMASAVAN